MKPSALLALSSGHPSWHPRHPHWIMQDIGTAGQPEYDHRARGGARRTRWRDPAWRVPAWVSDGLVLRGTLRDAVPIWAGPAAFSFDTPAAKHCAAALIMDMVSIAVPPELHGVNHA